MIEIRELSKVYRVGASEVRALDRVDLDIAANAYMAIMGPSGSGKSTLMNIIGCLDSPSHGSYLLDGERVSDMDDDALARIRNRQIGFVFQTFNLLPRADVYHNVELPLIYASQPAAERKRRVDSAIAAVSLGRTQRYGEIAKKLKSAPRAVGQACGRNPYPVIVPCHRVVGAGGLGGFAQARDGFLLEAKRWLLTHEGAL